MKFNFITKKKTATVNHEGAKAFKMTPEYELYSAVVTAGLNNLYYEKADDRLTRIVQLIQKCDANFVAKLAIYARNSMHLRSIPLVLAVELAKQNSGDSLVSKTVSQVVKRADEITELLAYYQITNKRTGVKKLNRLSKQVQKGLVKSFNSFDEYQFAKYNRQTEIKLKDALFLVHPKAKDESQQMLFNKIASDSLAIPYTWETELSKVGRGAYTSVFDKAAAITQTWETLIASKKIGYMAMMRNLRNILEANVSARHIEMVCDFISNEKAIANSKQLPFRFLAAYRELKRTNYSFTSVLLDALETAVLHSASNIKGFGYSTSVVIACDVSGSMQQPISPKSKILMYDIGLVLGMLMHSQCKNVTSGMFGDTWKEISMPKRSVLRNVNEFYEREGEVGYATNGYLVIKKLIKNRKVVDKVMLFTDLQMWNSNFDTDSFSKAWKQYKAMAPNAKLYLFDLAGHGKQPIDIQQNDVYLIAGWSDKVFDMLHAMDASNTALSEINAITL